MAHDQTSCQDTGTTPGPAFPPHGDRATRRFCDHASQVSWNPARLLESARLGICVTDLEGRVVYANPAFQELTGYCPDDTPGLDWRQDLCIEAREGEEEMVHESLLAGGAAARTTILLRPRHGRPMAVEADRHLGRDESGRPAYFFTFVHPPARTDQEARRAALPRPAVPVSPALPDAAAPSALRQALDRVMTCLGDATGTPPQSLVEFERCLTDRPSSIVGPTQDAAALSLGIAGGLGSLLAARGMSKDAVRVQVQAQCAPLPLETALLVECIVFDLVHGRLSAGVRKRPAALHVVLADGPDDRLRLTVTDDGRFFAKLKLHDRKEGGLSALAGAIIRRGGSIFLIRTDLTELKISLPR